MWGCSLHHHTHLLLDLSTRMCLTSTTCTHPETEVLALQILFIKSFIDNHKVCQTNKTVGFNLRTILTSSTSTSTTMSSRKHSSQGCCLGHEASSLQSNQIVLYWMKHSLLHWGLALLLDDYVFILLYCRYAYSINSFTWYSLIDCSTHCSFHHSIDFMIDNCLGILLWYRWMELWPHSNLCNSILEFLNPLHPVFCSFQSFWY